MSRAYLSKSPRSTRRRSSGVPPTASVALLRKWSRVPGSATALLMAALSRPITAAREPGEQRGLVRADAGGRAADAGLLVDQRDQVRDRINGRQRRMHRERLRLPAVEAHGQGIVEVVATQSHDVRRTRHVVVGDE